MMTTNRATKRPKRLRQRGGFTLVELLIVMIIGAALTTMAIPSFTRLMNARNAQNARDRLVWLANRARVRAMERGNVQLFEVSPSLNAAWIVRRNGAAAADTLERVRFTGEYSATVSTSTGNTITVCYSPRGYAFSCSANSPAANVEATLTHAGKTATARIKPLGQVERI